MTQQIDNLIKAHLKVSPAVRGNRDDVSGGAEERAIMARLAGEAWTLIVNDDQEISSLLTILAEELGLHPVIARREAEARHALERYPLALVITDSLAQPREPWVWVDELRARQWALARTRQAPPAPIMLVSAHHPTMFAAYQEHGVAAVLPAPFDVGEFTATVEVLLGARTDVSWRVAVAHGPKGVAAAPCCTG